MAADDVKLLQSSLILLRTALTEAEHFLSVWHVKYEGLEENYAEFKEVTRKLQELVAIATKELRSYKTLHEGIIVAKDLLNVARKLEDIITGPLVIIQASKNLAVVAQQVTKLIAQAGTIDTGDEEHIFSMLSADQINQVYQWVAENEAIRK